MKTASSAEGFSLRAAVRERLEEGGLVDPAAFARAELVSARTGQPVEQVLNQLGVLSDDNLVAAYEAVSSCPRWNPAKHPPQVAAEEVGVSVEFLRRNRLLPLEMTGKRLVCATCDPLDDQALSGLVFASGKTVTLMVASPGDWRRAFDKATSASEPSAMPDERRLEREIDLVADAGGEGAGARLISSVFETAVAAGASDIHFEPRRHELLIRLRIDGQLVDHQRVSEDFAGPAVSRIKVLANLDLGERRLPQDGRTTFVVSGRQVDVRVATSPTAFGEAAVLRILDRAALKLDLEALGLANDVLGVLRRAASSPHGLFLITGPTGSGKTTTLYALLQCFAGSAKKVLSVEDPIEYHFEHVVQTQVAPSIGLTFATALRSFLRQDPDVLLVGEIRDPETASVAVQAAMTGHLVLASVHANDAAGVVPRLLDMGIEPYQLAAGLRGAAAQRLVRRLCPDCSRGRPANDGEKAFAAALEGELRRVREPVGCPSCRGSGFKGRIAIGEAFEASEPLLRAIALSSVGDLTDELRRSTFRPMAADGLAKLAAGLSSFEEIAAAVHG
ncbi:MAG TPA: GspE/PulE family protein [Caulobacteraceae bacterium]|nr:GspE/PulE family protein [Caulobacteraceae bacterium]